MMSDIARIPNENIGKERCLYYNTVMTAIYNTGEQKWLRLYIFIDRDFPIFGFIWYEETVENSGTNKSFIITKTLSKTFSICSPPPINISKAPVNKDTEFQLFITI